MRGLITDGLGQDASSEEGSDLIEIAKLPSILGHFSKRTARRQAADHREKIHANLGNAKKSRSGPKNAKKRG